MLTPLGAVALDQAALRERLHLLTRQAGTGQRGETHGALGAEARRAIDLRGDIASREAHAAAAETALGRIGPVQSVLARLEKIAVDITADVARARTLGATGVQALARTARAALEEVAALLNTRQGGDHLFAGARLDTAPVPDGGAIATGPMATDIAAAVATLDPTNAATVLAATSTAVTAAATTPFDATLEAAAAEPRRAVRVAEGERVAWGVLANANHAGDAARSWGRELLRGLATLAALTPASAAQGAGYDALLDGIGTALSGTARDLAQERGVLGAAERRIVAIRDRHQDLLVALRTQLQSIEEVDLAEVSARIGATQLRLEASYRITAQLQSLSLAALLR
jgi:flagellin-like hook-associated protein FlgL